MFRTECGKANELCQVVEDYKRFTTLNHDDALKLFKSCQDSKSWIVEEKSQNGWLVKMIAMAFDEDGQSHPGVKLTVKSSDNPRISKIQMLIAFAVAGAGLGCAAQLSRHQSWFWNSTISHADGSIRCNTMGESFWKTDTPVIELVRKASIASAEHSDIEVWSAIVRIAYLLSPQCDETVSGISAVLRERYPGFLFFPTMITASVKCLRNNGIHPPKPTNSYHH
jgi:hypothetical protein